jgi:hypothetical protein
MVLIWDSTYIRKNKKHVNIKPENRKKLRNCERISLKTNYYIKHLFKNYVNKQKLCLA